MAELRESVPAAPAEVVREGQQGEGDAVDLPSAREAIEQPAKVMRVGTMMKQLLDEVRQATLDESSRDRLREIYATSIGELGSALSSDLREELDRLILPFPEGHPPSQAELQVAKAQLVGWLEGLIQGIQAALFAQQVSAQQQLANIRAELPPSPGPHGERGPGTYL
ncbi:MAG: DUF2587 domain-containing protein [bacterium]|nr:DUF2587 domain-containing protein [bacterium]MCY4271295.1 DUF2587 domain-containing protein [bacterium]